MPPTEPTERELEALKVLWEREEATVREIFEAMNAGGNTGADGLAYTTVLSLLQVMQQKGLVAFRKEGKAHVYRAKIKRERTFRQLAGGFLERVFDGAVDEYLVHALESRKLSADELDELDAMIAEARRTAKPAIGSKKATTKTTNSQRKGGSR
ncbi:BlaI/MecI/CopY family transcriptional regulator [Adhaeretor mobilis]|uniref:Penicillinase repressor n=1 Tax=Adhaeretor mobilis TaxID=1930276 RepID=A0A517MV82_9BACT|nr:BlaI/MecI/CopY family transcriptional regulator [Adhaeretor mobilis]QDS98697.1 Penicillinase repressor [Adhaeretor mobilis]